MNEVESVFQGIWERRYFANNGPLVVGLDREMAQRVGTRNAVCVVNPFVGLMFLTRALECECDVIVPALGAGSTADALRWAGANPVFCDVDETCILSRHSVGLRLTDRTRALVGVRLPGWPGDVSDLEQIALEADLVLFLDARQELSNWVEPRRVGSYGRAEVLTLPSHGANDGTQGACITTNDDALAARLRTMRSFHASETFAAVPLRANGKMSEAQAGLAGLALRRIDETRAQNQLQRQAYAAAFEDCEGVVVAGPNVAGVLELKLCFSSPTHGAIQLAELLVEQHIDARTYGLPAREFPVARRLAERIVMILDVAAGSERIAAICREFCRRRT